ncbi:putative glycoside hydrolase/deacetylase ChbG (UPF0249 family) [Peribacillus sp. V2I11]|nr:putative glycoside hydrolase/deacetylase ChbG (UPF0249 family) [Peribacillus sp. V2I11]
MIEVLVNADDFGLTKAVNYGILDSHKYGIVNSATIMMNAIATEHAIEIAKKTPSLKVGIHLVLTWGKPLLSDVPSLVDESGFFKKQGMVYGSCWYFLERIGEGVVSTNRKILGIWSISDSFRQPSSCTRDHSISACYKKAV